MSNPFELELFDPSKHDRSTFDCKEPSLNDYLNKYAKQDIKRDITRMHVIVKNGNPSKLIYGYFTLTTYSLGCGEFSDDFLHGMPKYELIPAILVGRLAKNFNQTEIRGYDILFVALHKSKKLSKEIGAKFVVVDCLNQKAKDFYLKHGFKELKTSGMKLVLPISSIPD